jgi:hypothetical protein
MPDELWAAASQRYLRIYDLLTGEDFCPGSYPVEPRLEQNLRQGGIL